MEFTKEDKDKLGQILKELKEVGEMIKGGEGSGIKGHKTQERENQKRLRVLDPRLARIRTKEIKRESALQYPNKISNRERRIAYP